MARDSSKEKLLETFETKNDQVVFCLAELTGDYIMYELAFEERHDFIVTFEDRDLAHAVCKFMVEAYNDGFTDGKNNMLMFQNS